MTNPSITNKDYNTESKEAPPAGIYSPGGALFIPEKEGLEKLQKKFFATHKSNGGVVEYQGYDRCEIESKSAYLEYIDKVVTLPEIQVKLCPGYCIIGECENGHQYAAEIYCGKEWCKVCGEMDSKYHKRKQAKWIPKAQSLRSMLNITMTIPKEIRERYITKAALSDLSKRMVNGDKSKKYVGILKAMGYARGFIRWHFFSPEQPGVYNPHLNVAVEGGRISKTGLRRIKKEWARLLGVEMAVVHVQYTTEPQKMMHWIKYVTRATFLERFWDDKLADELYGFRNMRVFGKWTGELAWELEQKEQEELNECSSIERNICPECGTAITWYGGVYDIIQLQIWKAAGWAHEIGNGYYRMGGGRGGRGDTVLSVEST